MSYDKQRGAMKQYSQVAVQSDAHFASPHRLIQMLMDGALQRIAAAKGDMQRGNIAQKGTHISWAISIIEGLRASLNMEAGGEIARNLDNLYEYMCWQLLQANLKNAPELLDEVASLLREIKSAWDAIPDSAKQGPGAAEGVIVQHATVAR